jgi:hypothetical protein
MADGWLFRLSATLGARQSVPSWPSAPAPADAAPAPALRTPDRVEPPAPATPPERG